MSGYPREYIEYLVQFHGVRDYFECHEIMEEYWKKDSGSPMTPIWLGLIQVAVGLYHERRGNRVGALKMLESSLSHLYEEGMARVGIDGDAFTADIRERIVRLKQHQAEPKEEPYRDMDISFADPDLDKLCADEAAKLSVPWIAPSDLSDEMTVHKHLRRDRSGVVRERLARLEEKRKLRGMDNQ